MKPSDITYETELHSGNGKKQKNYSVKELMDKLKERFPKGFRPAEATQTVLTEFGGLPSEFRSARDLYQALEKQEYLGSTQIKSTGKNNLRKYYVKQQEQPNETSILRVEVPRGLVLLVATYETIEKTKSHEEFSGILTSGIEKKITDNAKFIEFMANLKAIAPDAYKKHGGDYLEKIKQ